MKIVIITQEDPIYLGAFFEEFLMRIGNQEDIRVQKIVINKTLRSESRWALLKRIFPLYRSRGILLLFTRVAIHKVWTFLPSIIKGDHIFNVEDATRLYGIPVVRADNINEDGFLQSLREHDPDIVLSVSAAQIFKSALLRLPRHGCVNIHCGKIPEYRGMLPSFWQMYHGERECVITVHYMGEKIDDGDILFEVPMAIDYTKSLDHHIRATKRHSAEVIVGFLQRMKTGNVKAHPLSKENARYFTFPNARDADGFRKKGLRVV